jgi:hypothetical protein
MTINSCSRREHEHTVMSLKLIFDNMTVWPGFNVGMHGRNASSICTRSRRLARVLAMENFNPLGVPRLPPVRMITSSADGLFANLDERAPSF